MSTPSSPPLPPTPPHAHHKYNTTRNAFLQAALKFHPDRPGGDKVKFQEVSEAFEVLSDSKKKQLYDQFGEAGLGAAGGAQDDDPMPGGGANPSAGMGMGGGMPGGAQTFTFRTTHGGGGGGGFHGSDPFSVFESIFGTMDVDQAMGSAEGEGGEQRSLPLPIFLLVQELGDCCAFPLGQRRSEVGEVFIS